MFQQMSEKMFNTCHDIALLTMIGYDILGASKHEHSCLTNRVRTVLHFIDLHDSTIFTLKIHDEPQINEAESLPGTCFRT